VKRVLVAIHVLLRDYVLFHFQQSRISQKIFDSLLLVLNDKSAGIQGLFFERLLICEHALVVSYEMMLEEVVSGL
jgi:hypothetical protein